MKKEDFDTFCLIIDSASIDELDEMSHIINCLKKYKLSKLVH